MEGKPVTRRMSNCSRLIGVTDLCSYIGLGRNRAMQFAKNAGAEVRIGRRCLYDIRALDAAIDKLKNT